MSECKCISRDCKIINFLRSKFPIIEKQKLILVEGVDEIYFFDALIKFLNLRDIEIWDYEGNSQLSSKFSDIIKIPGFDNISSLAILQDADTNANSAFASISSILSKNGFTPPVSMNQFSTNNPKIGVFIMPNNNSNGMLEDLCLKAVNTQQNMRCVINFERWIKRNINNPNQPTNWSKAKTQVFLASMRDIVNRVGLGAQKGYWNFPSNVYDDIKQFLSNL